MAEGGGRDRAAYERDGELVLAARAGDDAAFAQLFNGWFDPVFDAARRIVDDNDIAAEIAQDTFLSVWQHLGDLREPSTFGAFALRTARNKALNRSAKERRSVAVDDTELVPVLDGGQPLTDTADVLSQQEGDALVWAASAALGDREASILDLHLRHGLTAPELADELGVTPNNAHQLLFRMKKKLGAAIAAWVLWKGGSPSCEDLVRELDRAGVQRFSADAVRVINKHVERCAACGDRKAAVLAPEALFASVPIAVVAPAIRARVAGNLHAQGVPVLDEAVGTSTPLDETNAGRTDTGATDTGGTSGAEFDITSGSSPAKRRLVLASVAAVLLLLLLGGGIAMSRGSSTNPVIESAGTAEPTSTSKTAPVSPIGSTPGTDDVDPAAAAPGDTEPADDTAPDPEPDQAGDPRNGSTTTAAPNVIDPGNQTQPTVTIPPSIVTIPVPTTTTPPGPPPPPPPPPPGPPTIDTFTKTTLPAGPPCGSTQYKIRFAWTTTDVYPTGVTISGTNAPAGPQAADGNVTICVPMFGVHTYVLTAGGPGGAPDTATLTVP